MQRLMRNWLVTAVLGACLASGELASAATINVSQGCNNSTTSKADSGLFNASAGVADPNLLDSVATGSASAGVLHLSAEAIGFDSYPDAGVFCSASASGETHEYIFVDAPFLGRGTATVQVSVTGGVEAHSSPTSSAYAAATVSWSVGFSGASRTGSEIVISRFGTTTDSPEGSHPGTFTFTTVLDFDSWVPLDIGAAVTAGTYDYGALSGYFYPGSASASANYGHSFSFDGILGIVDENGAPVEFSAIGESGRDYRLRAVPPTNAVPEPSTALLLLLALFALSAARTRPSRH